ncbi:hypothetical protein OUZ56_022638 [Daphnia magna]|uniref:Uncharacterized protein n=1 Tax=Daphnia magna TaxID=35525 RepID=A0ABR0AX65_9CRUS|nr:hypothetical protein OUZ56_022638 [Daphnia magna]
MYSCNARRIVGVEIRNVPGQQVPSPLIRLNVLTLKARQVRIDPSASGSWILRNPCIVHAEQCSVWMKKIQRTGNKNQQTVMQQIKLKLEKSGKQTGFQLTLAACTELGSEEDVRLSLKAF